MKRELLNDHKNWSQAKDTVFGKINKKFLILQHQKYETFFDRFQTVWTVLSFQPLAVWIKSDKAKLFLKPGLRRTWLWYYIPPNILADTQNALGNMLLKGKGLLSLCHTWCSWCYYYRERLVPRNFNFYASQRAGMQNAFTSKCKNFTII